MVPLKPTCIWVCHRRSNSYGSISVSAPSRQSQEMVELVQGIATVGAVGREGETRASSVLTFTRLSVREAGPS
jgi:hypothetical protein